MCLGNVGVCQLKGSLCIPLYICIAQMIAIQNNFPDQGCGSGKPPLASLPLHSLLPISELSINIYEGI